MLTKHLPILVLGALIALLASACAPQVQMKGTANLTGNGIANGTGGKDGKTALNAATGEGLSKIVPNTSNEDGTLSAVEAVSGDDGKKTKDEVLANFLKDPKLLSAIKDYEKKLQVDCVDPRRNQIHSQCAENAPCELSLDITCTSRITTQADVQALMKAAAAAAAITGGPALGLAAIADSKVDQDQPEGGDLYRITVQGALDYATATGQWNLEKATLKHLQIKSEDWKAAE